MEGGAVDSLFPDDEGWGVEPVEESSSGSPFPLADEVMKYLKNKGVQKADIYIPYFLASVGAHAANLRVRCIPFTWADVDDSFTILSQFGLTPDLRSHILFVAPPSWGKTFFMRLMIDPKFGVVAPSTVPHLMATWATEAGLAGSFGTGGNKEPVKVDGDAEIYSDGIYACDEMSSFLQDKHVDYNQAMTNTLLQILDTGHIYKRLVLGQINSWTRMTMWGGTQPLRLSLENGIARRFIILRLSPTLNDEEEYKDAHSHSYNEEIDLDSLVAIRELVHELFTAARFEHITFSHAYVQWRSQVKAQHQDLSWIDKLAIGWAMVSRTTFQQHVLRVDVDDQLKIMVEQALRWRASVMIDGPFEDVVALMGSSTYERREVYDLMMRLGIGRLKAKLLLHELLEEGVLLKEQEGSRLV